MSALSSANATGDGLLSLKVLYRGLRRYPAVSDRDGCGDQRFYSARLGPKKPDMEFFAKVQAAVALCGEEMLLIDDSRQNIEATQKAGWQALHWTKHSSPNAQLVYMICR